MTLQYGKPVRFEKVENPAKEQAQRASEIVFQEVKRMHERSSATAAAR